MAPASPARLRLRPIRPAFEAEKLDGKTSEKVRPPREAMWTKRPQPCARSRGSTAFDSMKDAIKLTEST
jgi:hypothetical protein